MTGRFFARANGGAALAAALAAALLLAVGMGVSAQPASAADDAAGPRLGSAWVATRDLPRGAQIGPSDMRLEQKEARRIPRDAAAPGDEVVGLQLRRGVRKGRIVRERWLEAVSKVKRGDLVRIVVRSGGLQIVGKGRAVTDGAIGDRIRVVNTDSRREITGRVTRDGSIHVDL